MARVHSLLRRLYWTIALLVVAGLPVSARAAPVNVFEDGNALYRYCVSTSAFDQGVCLGYVVGIGDVIQEKRAAFVACFPAQAMSDQLRDVVIRFLASHPEKLPLSAAGLVGEALQTTFPCH